MIREHKKRSMWAFVLHGFGAVLFVIVFVMSLSEGNRGAAVLSGIAAVVNVIAAIANRRRMVVG